MFGSGYSICGVSIGAGEVVEKKVEKVVRGGCNAAVLTIEAGACTKCDERYYAKETHEKMQKIRKKLEQGFTEVYRLIGHTYAYAIILLMHSC